MATQTVTYSFLDCYAAIVGPGAAFSLGAGAALAEEGISLEMVEDKGSMLVGADGSVMHSLHAGHAGNATIRLLKTSPTNLLLAAAYNFQRLTAVNWGQNVIVIRLPTLEDVITCSAVAFRRWPSLTYAKDGGINEWSFLCGQIEGILGAGTISNAP